MKAKDRIKKHLLIRGFEQRNEDIFEKHLSIHCDLKIVTFMKSFRVTLRIGYFIIYSYSIEYTQATNEICKKIDDLCNVLNYFSFKTNY